MLAGPFSRGLAGLLAAGVVAAPDMTQSSLSDLLGSQMCLASAGDVSAEPMPEHPHQATASAGSAPFDPRTTELDLKVSALDGGEPIAGTEARITLSLRDAASGRPVSGQSVAGWMLLRRNAQVAAELSCGAKAKLFTQGRVTARPDVDLNAARMMILNRDGTIGIADPQVDFTITQMEAVVPLPGVPADWAMGADGRTLFVSLPVFGAVAVVDTRSFKMTGLMELGKGTLPTQLSPLPDGRLAIYLSGAGAIAIAKADGPSAEPIAVGPGPVALAATGSGTLFVAASDGSLTAIGAGAPRRATPGHSGEPSIAVVAGRLFVAGTGSREILALDTATLVVRGRIPVEPGVVALAAEPGGQLLALNRRQSTLSLIDPAAGTVLAAAPVARAPVEIAFSHDYLYVRGLEGDHFTVVELAELARGRIAPLNVQSASRPMPGREALARARLIAPYGHGALVANPDEAVAYYYMEGMNSPMGTVKTYGPSVQGIMIADRSLRETEPGVYQTTAVLPHGGTYDVPVAIGGEGFVTCFTATARPAPETAIQTARRSLRIEAEPLSPLAARTGGELVFRILDARTGAPAEGLRDVRLLAFASGGTWQARQWATPLGDGRYAGRWSFPRAGRYGIALSVRSRGLGPADTPPVYVTVTNARDAAPDRRAAR